MSGKTLEQNFKRLEELTTKMESGELSLEQMYALYKEGIDLVKDCGKKIDMVEKNMKIINSSGESSDFE